LSYNLRWFVAAMMAALIVVAWLPIEQRGAIAQSEKGLKSALTMYAVARGLNAVISVAQGTRVALQPVGVGVELAAGEALKPLQELLDQFGTAMLAAAAVFGLQIVLMKLGAHWALCALLTVIGVCGVTWWWWRGHMPRVLMQLFLVLLVLRFAVPVSTSLSNWVHDQVLEPDVKASVNALEGTKKYSQPQLAPPQDLEKVLKGVDDDPKASLLPSLTGLRKFISGFSSEVVRASGSVSAMVADLSRAAEGMAEAMVKVAVAFLVQTVVLPLVFASILIFLLRVMSAALFRHAQSP
jgi:hypothetical protein